MPVPAPTRPVARHLLLVALAAATSACAASEAATRPAPRRGDLSGAIAPDRDDAAITALRAEAGRDRRVLDRLLAAHDAAPAGPGRDALAATIDRVAGQRYATTSRLYWYTDLAAARAEAHRRRLPILSLRLLGRLDEDLSCANSRFFRTLLYANRELAAYLDAGFVLHWSSERPVPRVTIDFGDGRRLERTVTGNSAHYVLDADGRPVDVLPGLYAPAVFRAELERAARITAAVAGLSAADRAAALRAYHQAGLARTSGNRPVVVTPPNGDPVVVAQRGTIAKAAIEVPDLRIIDVGVDPGAADDGAPYWAMLGRRFFPLAAGTTLDAQSRALVTSLVTAGEPSAVLAAVEETVIADTALNELRLRAQIRSRLIADPAVDFAALNAWIYREVFHTPADDAWLGLLPRTAYLALPGDGVAR
jgi:hypothetical protein